MFLTWYVKILKFLTITIEKAKLVCKREELVKREELCQEIFTEDIYDKHMLLWYEDKMN